MRRDGRYQYQVYYAYRNSAEHGYTYEIFNLEEVPLMIAESDVWFDTEIQAELAAMGHVGLIQKGELKCLVN